MDLPFAMNSLKSKNANRFQKPAELSFEPATESLDRHLAQLSQLEKQLNDLLSKADHTLKNTKTNSEDQSTSQQEQEDAESAENDAHSVFASATNLERDASLNLARHGRAFTDTMLKSMDFDRVKILEALRRNIEIKKAKSVRVSRPRSKTLHAGHLELYHKLKNQTLIRDFECDESVLDENYRLAFSDDEVNVDPKVRKLKLAKKLDYITKLKKQRAWSRKEPLESTQESLDEKEKDKEMYMRPGPSPVSYVVIPQPYIFMQRSPSPPKIIEVVEEVYENAPESNAFRLKEIPSRREADHVEASPSGGQPRHQNRIVPIVKKNKIGSDAGVPYQSSHGVTQQISPKKIRPDVASRNQPSSRVNQQASPNNLVLQQGSSRVDRQTPTNLGTNNYRTEDEMEKVRIDMDDPTRRGSDNSLINATASEILGESSFDDDGSDSNAPHRKKEDVIQRFVREARYDASSPIVRASSRRQKLGARIFRYLNFLRALGTTAYGFYLVSKQWNDPAINQIGAKNYLNACLAFLSLDILLTAIKAFPKVFWFCWDVRDWDPFARTFSVWNLVADHELLIDMSPVLANVILKVYGFRLGQITKTLAVTDPSSPFASLGVQVDGQTANFSMLVVYAVTLFMTIFLHTFRLSSVLINKKHAIFLAVIVCVKVLLVIYDLATNAFLLYEILVFKQESIFAMGLVINLALAVVSVSPLLGMTTNVLVNLPLHVSHLKMQLKSRRLSNGMRGSDVSFRRVLKAALRKTFHPFILVIFGTYTLFALGALCYILYLTYNWDYSQVFKIPPAFSGTFVPSSPNPNDPTTASSVFTWEWWRSPQNRQTLLITMLWLNIIVNYAAGIISAILYWLWHIVDVILHAVCCHSGYQNGRRASLHGPLL